MLYIIQDIPDETRDSEGVTTTVALVMDTRNPIMKRIITLMTDMLIGRAHTPIMRTWRPPGGDVAM